MAGRQGSGEDEYQDRAVLSGFDEDEHFPEDEDTGSTEGESEGEETQGAGQSQQPQSFKFSDEKQPEATGGQGPGGEGQGGESEYMDIVYRGEKKRIHKDKARELAQKGFDYDSKVGPHSRYAQLMDRDPELARQVDAMVRQRYEGPAQAPQQPQQQPQQQQPADPLGNMEDDEPLTAADARKAFQQIMQQQQTQQIDPNRINQQIDQRVSQSAQQLTQQQKVDQIDTILASRDPEGAPQIAPRLQSEAEAMYNAGQLSDEQVRRLNNLEPGPVVEFYDYVRAKYLGKGNQQPQEGQPQGGNAPFRMQSGGGTPPRKGEEGERYWDMPNKEFQEKLERIRGLG